MSLLHGMADRAIAGPGEDGGFFYIHPGLSFGFDAPAGWKGRTYPTGIRLTRGQSAFHVAFVASRDATVARLLESIENNPKAASTQRLEDAQLTIDGRSARSLLYRVSPRGGRDKLTRIVTLPVDGGFYVFGGDFPDESYWTHKGEFESVLDSFRVAATTEMAFGNGRSRPSGASQRAARQAEPNRPPSLVHRYQEDGLGFSFRYPDGFSLERRSTTSVMLTGVPGGGYEGTVILMEFVGTGDASLDELLDHYKQNLSSDYPDIRFSAYRDRQVSDRWLQGRELGSEMTIEGIRAGQLLTVVKDDQRRYYMMGVFCPLADLERHGEMLGLMLDSLTPGGSE
jgi:hypothetical protein